MWRPYKIFKYEWNMLYMECSVCWEMKTEDKFYKNRGKPFGLHPRCKECRKKYAIKDKEKFKEYQKEYHKNNSSRIYKQHKEHDKKFLSDLWYNIKTFHGKATRRVIKYWLRPDRCPICWWEKKIEMHHPSYSEFNKWCEVVFCCSECHHGIHAWFIKCPNPINLKNLVLNEQ